jgi:hypothetical protein
MLRRSIVQQQRANAVSYRISRLRACNGWSLRGKSGNLHPYDRCYILHGNTNIVCTRTLDQEPDMTGGFYSYASRLLAVALRAVFGESWVKIPNHLPASAGITTSNLLAFFLTWLFQFPTAWLHPKNAGPLFVIKSIFSPLSYFVTMIWALVAFKDVKLDLGTKDLSGGALGWGFMKSINTVVSGVVCQSTNSWSTEIDSCRSRQW